MTLRDWDDDVRYKVVVNRDQMYSIWPADRENPLGWKEVGWGGGMLASTTSRRSGRI